MLEYTIGQSETAPEIPSREAGATRVLLADFGDADGPLDSSEVLTGTPTITEVTTSDLTIANKAVSTAQRTVNGRTAAIGEVVQAAVTGGTAGLTYTIQISVGTDATPAQTLIRFVKHTVF